MDKWVRTMGLRESANKADRQTLLNSKATMYLLLTELYPGEVTKKYGMQRSNTETWRTISSTLWKSMAKIDH